MNCAAQMQQILLHIATELLNDLKNLGLDVAGRAGAERLALLLGSEDGRGLGEGGL